MTYNVFGGTLNLAQSINQALRLHSHSLFVFHNPSVCTWTLQCTR